MVNCAAIALYKSELECRCVPVAISMLIQGGDRKTKNEINWVNIDPNNAQIKNQSQYSHKATFVMNVNTEEFISSSIKSLGKS